jgi:hypothetical protein
MAIWLVNWVLETQAKVTKRETKPKLVIKKK